MGFEGITSFSEKPLMLVFMLGAIISPSRSSARYLTIVWFSGHLLSGWASVMVSIWMLGGLTIASMGILGLYIARIFIETKQRRFRSFAVHDSQVASFKDGETRSTRIELFDDEPAPIGDETPFSGIEGWTR